MWARYLPGGIAVRGPARLFERNATAYRTLWPMYLAGFVEPALYLFSIGIGVGALVGDLAGPNGPVTYEAFVAPGLLAASAMNGSILDTTFNFFVKFEYVKTYDAVLATPLRPRDIAVGEVAWSLSRGVAYAGAFVLAMLALGLIESWWGLLALPAAVLIGLAFAGAGLAGATFMRSWVDFDLVNLAIMPMFLFSATFFPLDRYPGTVQAVVRLTPLYQGVELERSLVLGGVGWHQLLNVAYLAAMGVAGLRIASRRLDARLQP